MDTIRSPKDDIERCEISSADLAAFRRSIGPQWIVNPPTGHNGLATTDELQHGIGYSATTPEPPPSRGPIPARYVSDSRREASRMRSAAFARTSLHTHHASPTERTYGVPIQGPTARGTTQAEYYFA